jgi:hypothetical protein
VAASSLLSARETAAMVAAAAATVGVVHKSSMGKQTEAAAAAATAIAQGCTTGKQSESNARLAQSMSSDAELLANIDRMMSLSSAGTSTATTVVVSDWPEKTVEASHWTAAASSAPHSQSTAPRYVTDSAGRAPYRSMSATQPVPSVPSRHWQTISTLLPSPTFAPAHQNREVYRPDLGLPLDSGAVKGLSLDGRRHPGATQPIRGGGSEVLAHQDCEGLCPDLGHRRDHQLHNHNHDHNQSTFLETPSLSARSPRELPTPVPMLSPHMELSPSPVRAEGGGQGGGGGGGQRGEDRGGGERGEAADGPGAPSADEDVSLRFGYSDDSDTDSPGLSPEIRRRDDLDDYEQPRFQTQCAPSDRLTVASRY